MKIISFNLNGIRSAISKGLLDWLGSASPDVVCFQELKASVDQIPLMDFELLGYHHFWFPAKKKGYSGVGILSKVKPDNVVYGMGDRRYDDEGRFLRIDIGDLSIVSVYHPSGTTGDERQAFKMQWLTDFQNYVNTLRNERRQLILAGDYNICREAIDIHNPKGNEKTSGFLPEERSWFADFLHDGYLDSFRVLHPDEKDRYSWWSFRANARQNNKGWRIDYLITTENMRQRLVNASIHSDVVFSDHCPVELVLDD